MRAVLPQSGPRVSLRGGVEKDMESEKGEDDSEEGEKEGRSAREWNRQSML